MGQAKISGWEAIRKSVCFKIRRREFISRFFTYFPQGPEFDPRHFPFHVVLFFFPIFHFPFSFFIFSIIRVGGTAKSFDGRTKSNVYEQVERIHGVCVTRSIELQSRSIKGERKKKTSPMSQIERTISNYIQGIDQFVFFFYHNYGRFNNADRNEQPLLQNENARCKYLNKKKKKKKRKILSQDFCAACWPCKISSSLRGFAQVSDTVSNISEKTRIYLYRHLISGHYLEIRGQNL